ncbi:MAG: hypothetical protein HC893_02885 [Chloroflexaceae bacterium]|nr:hypothetical protein [Chloroflexaceae bacterium]
MGENKITDGGCGVEVTENLYGPLTMFIWPFMPEHIDDTINFLLFRELPEPLEPGSRDVEVWVRADLVNGTGDVVATGSGGGAAPLLRLVAVQELGSPQDFSNPTGITMDSAGRIYIADTLNHRIQVYNADGDLIETIGEYGAGEGQFNEPRGLAVDADDNLYVADTWNARVVKIAPDGEWLATWGSGSEDLGGGRMVTMTGATAEGNTATPLGFFGPRDIAIST